MIIIFMIIDSCNNIVCNANKNTNLSRFVGSFVVCTLLSTSCLKERETKKVRSKYFFYLIEQTDKFRALITIECDERQYTLVLAKPWR